MMMPKKLYDQIFNVCSDTIKRFIDSGDPWWRAEKEDSDPFTVLELAKIFARALVPYQNNVRIFRVGNNIYLVKAKLLEEATIDEILGGSVHPHSGREGQESNSEER